MNFMYFFSHKSYICMRKAMKYVKIYDYEICNNEFRDKFTRVL